MVGLVVAGVLIALLKTFGRPGGSLGAPSRLTSTPRDGAPAAGEGLYGVEGMPARDDAVKATWGKRGQMFMVLSDYQFVCAQVPGCLLENPAPLRPEEVAYVVVTGSTTQDERLTPIVADWAEALPKYFAFR